MDLAHQSVVIPRESACTMLSLLIPINLLILQSLQTGTSFFAQLFIFIDVYIYGIQGFPHPLHYPISQQGRLLVSELCHTDPVFRHFFISSGFDQNIPACNCALDHIYLTFSLPAVKKLLLLKVYVFITVYVQTAVFGKV